MLYNEQIQDLIDRYLADHLSPGERQDFEQRLQKEPALREILRLNQEVNETLADTGETALRANLQAIGARQVAAPPRRIIPLWQKSAAAAAMLVLLAVAWLVLRPEPLGPTALFNAHFETGKMDRVEVPRSLSKISTLQYAQMAYNDSLYSEALPYFETHLNKNPKDWESRIYAGKAAAAAGELEKAVNFLIPVSNSNDPLKWAATWNLALINLKQERPEEAGQRLKLIQKNADPELAKKAKKLLIVIKRQ